MKRSRDSEYNKKRPREKKKDSKRKFTFSTNTKENKDTSKDRESRQRSTSRDKDARRTTTSKKNEAQQAHVPPQKKPLTEAQNHATDFEVYTQTDTQYQQRKTHQKKKGCLSNAKWPVSIIAIFFVVKLLLNVSRCNQNSATDTIPNRYDQERVTTTPPKRSSRTSSVRLSSVDISRYMVGRGKKLREVMQLEEDSTLTIVPNVEVRLFKGFHIYDSQEFPTTPVVAKYSKYYFFYDVQEKSTTESMTNQWISLREKFINDANDDYFYHENYQNYTVKNLTVNEKKFSLLVDGIVIYGAATLIEHKNKRYFFHFISKEKIDAKPSYRFLRKYLDYYLKIDGKAIK